MPGQFFGGNVSDKAHVRITDPNLIPFCQGFYGDTVVGISEHHHQDIAGALGHVHGVGKLRFKNQNSFIVGRCRFSITFSVVQCGGQPFTTAQST